LVKYGYQWPGARSCPSDIGSTRTIRRPHVFFRKDGLPEEITLTLTAPPALRHLTRDEAVGLLDKALVAKETEYREAHGKKGTAYFGRRNVRKQSPFDAPGTNKRKGAINPRIKCADVQLRADALAALKQFWAAHAAARRIHCSGSPDAVFPAGTYLHRVTLGVPCAVA